MTNTYALRKAIESAGFKYKYIAEQLGLSSYGLQKKIDNKTEFKASEIEKISNILSLSIDKRMSIFFAAGSDLKSLSGK